MSMETMRSYVASNPRITGVLFTMLLLLSQAGSAAAGGCGIIAGP
jgi:hypothetical protein